MTNTQKCSNPLCGNPMVSGQKCPYCGTPLGRKLYPFEFRLLSTIAGAAAAITLIVLILVVGISTVRDSQARVQTADAQNTLIAQTEIAPLPSWETRLKPENITINQSDQFGISPTVMVWSESSTNINTSISPLELTLDQDIWLITSSGMRRFDARVTDNNSLRLSVGEDQTDGAFVWRLSPDGQWLGHNIRTDLGREIRLYNLTDGTSLTTDFRRNGVDFAWSRDAQWMILNLTEGATNVLRVVRFSDLLTRPDRALSESARSIASGLIGAVDWSSQGIVAYTINEANRLRIRLSRYEPSSGSNQVLGEIDLSTHIPDRTLTRSLRWSPDGEHLAFTIAQSATDDQPRIYIIESTKRWGMVLHQLMPARPYASPAWISNDQVLIVGSDYSAWVINISSRQLSQVVNLSANSEIVDYIKP